MSKKTSQKLSPEEVRDLLTAVRQLQAGSQKTQRELLLARIGIGEHLAKLKHGVGYGKWLPTLKKLRFNERTAQRLMVIAASPLASLIRATARISTIELPLDLAALELLAKLPEATVKKALAEWQFDLLTVAAIRKKVREVLGKQAKGKRARTTEENDDHHADDHDNGQEGEQGHTEEGDPGYESDSDAETGEYADDEESGDDEHYADEASDGESTEYDNSETEEYVDDPVARVVSAINELETTDIDSATEAIRREQYDVDYLNDLVAAAKRVRKQLQRLVVAATELPVNVSG